MEEEESADREEQDSSEDDAPPGATKIQIKKAQRLAEHNDRLKKERHCKFSPLKYAFVPTGVRGTTPINRNCYYTSVNLIRKEGPQQYMSVKEGDMLSTDLDVWHVIILIQSSDNLRGIFLCLDPNSNELLKVPIDAVMGFMSGDRSVTEKSNLAYANLLEEFQATQKASRPHYRAKVHEGGGGLNRDDRESLAIMRSQLEHLTHAMDTLVLSFEVMQNTVSKMHQEFKTETLEKFAEIQMKHSEQLIAMSQRRGNA